MPGAPFIAATSHEWALFAEANDRLPIPSHQTSPPRKGTRSQPALSEVEWACRNKASKVTQGFSLGPHKAAPQAHTTLPEAVVQAQRAGNDQISPSSDPPQIPVKMNDFAHYPQPNPPQHLQQIRIARISYVSLGKIEIEDLNKEF